MLNTSHAVRIITESKSARLVRVFSLVVPFALSALFLLRFSPQVSFSGFQLPLVFTSSLLNLVLVGTYFYSYKAFDDHFYFFIASFWLSIAIYAILDYGSPVPHSPEWLQYKSATNLLYVSASAFLIIAILLIDRRTILFRLKKTIIVVLSVGLGYLAFVYFLASRLEAAEQSATLLMVPGAAISFFALSVVGAAQSDRLRSRSVDSRRRVILVAFYTYAILSFFSPFTRILGVGALTSFFLLSQLAKLSNTIALQSITALEYAKVRYEVDVRLADLKIAQAELQRKNQLAELGALAASIKHDINTPLATMGFEIDTLRDLCQHDHRLIRRLERLEECTERIYAIVKVVDIVRGDRSFFDRDQFMNKVSMLEIVHRGVRSVKKERPELLDYNAKTFIKIEGRDLFVSAYGPMFEQVIVNIIKNGLEAIEEARRERGMIRIIVSLEQGRTSTYSRENRVEILDSEWYDYTKWVRVEIEDNGTGIERENLGKLTTLFTTKGDRKPNSGIGLFISKKILDIHEGRIAFQSEVGKGTIVSILLPEWGEVRRSQEQYFASPVDLDSV